MKKIASLFLVVTLFYNVLGLYTIFAEQQQQMWVNSMEKTDDSNFEVIEVAINPYAYIVDSGFEYANEDLGGGECITSGAVPAENRNREVARDCIEPVI